VKQAKPDAPKRTFIAAKAVLGVAAGVALLFAALIGAGVFGRGLTAGGLGADMVNAPNVINLYQDRAVETFSQAGLNLVFVDRQTSQQAALGTVMSQTPRGGAAVRRGGDVEAVISDGRPKLPDVTRKAANSGNSGNNGNGGNSGNGGSPGGGYERMPESEAVAALEALGLSCSLKAAYDNTVPEGFVILQSPAAGAEFSEGDEVTLIISMGADESAQVIEVKLPDFTAAASYAGIGDGTASEANAAELAASLKLRLMPARSRYTEEPAGTVYAQHLPKGLLMPEGTEIGIEVSRGAHVDPYQLIADLSGARSDGEIKQMANDMGLMVAVLHRYSENYQPGMIFRVMSLSDSARYSNNYAGDAQADAGTGGGATAGLLSFAETICVYVSDGKDPRMQELSASQSVSGELSASQSESWREQSSLSSSESQSQSQSQSRSQSILQSEMLSQSISQSSSRAQQQPAATRATTRAAPQRTTRAEPMPTTAAPTSAAPTAAPAAVPRTAAPAQAPTLPAAASREAPTLPGR
jgi:beta-lactam-binding protein with PASTA domain